MSDLDEREEENIRNLQAAVVPPQRSSSTVSILASRSSSMKRRKAQVAKAEDSITRSATILATALNVSPLLERTRNTAPFQ